MVTGMLEHKKIKVEELIETAIDLCPDNKNDDNPQNTQTAIGRKEGPSSKWGKLKVKDSNEGLSGEEGKARVKEEEVPSRLF